MACKVTFSAVLGCNKDPLIVKSAMEMHGENMLITFPFVHCNLPLEGRPVRYEETKYGKRFFGAFPNCSYNSI